MDPYPPLTLLPLDDAQRDQALSLILAPEDAARRLPRAQVIGFRLALQDCGIRLQCWAACQDEQQLGLVCLLILPGDSALLMTAAPGRWGMTRGGCLAAVRGALQHVSPQRLHFAQTLLEPEGHEKRAVFEQAGFARLTDMIYLEIASRDLAPTPRALPAARWVSYARSTHALFVDALRRSYEGSLDCQELSRMRSTEDAIAAHRAAGPFEPALWQVLLLEERLAGCVLTARMPQRSALEVVYVGVAAEFRRGGVGSSLLARAASLARDVHAERITLAVDVRNTPARALYSRLGFAPLRVRSAWFYRWPQAASGTSGA